MVVCVGEGLTQIEDGAQLVEGDLINRAYGVVDDGATHEEDKHQYLDIILRFLLARPHAFAVYCEVDELIPVFILSGDWTAP